MKKWKLGGLWPVLLGIVMVGVTMVGGAAAQNDALAAGCDGKQIVIADLQWPSASILAEIHAQIVEQNLNCSTSVAQFDIESAATTLKTAQTPTLIPEMWVTRVASKWNQVVQERAGFAAGNTFDQAIFEGWYVPPRVAADFPALRQVTNLKNMRELYQLDQKPDFITCPTNWACSVLNENMLKAFGLWSAFNIVVPTDRLEMDRLIGEAISKNKPIMFYYWQPNAFVYDLKLVRIEMGAYSSTAFACLANVECKDLQTTGFADEQVVIAVADWVRGDAPELLPYARKAQMPLDAMDELLSVQVESGLTAEQVATYFIVNYPQIWQAWLPVVQK